MPAGKILSVIDLGATWQLLYEMDGNGLGIVTFDRRPFARFYKGATGCSFHGDYNSGQGSEYISQQLKGLRISVEGERPSQVVRLKG